jgi:hypothetical protein
MLRKIFGASEPITVESLRGAHQEVEREHRVVVRRWERQRKQLLERMKGAGGEGNHLEVDYLWEQFKLHRTDGVDIRREGRVRNLEALALGRTVRALDRLEQKKDRAGARVRARRAGRARPRRAVAQPRGDERDPRGVHRTA